MHLSSCAMCHQNNNNKKKRSEFWLLLQEHRREKLAKAKRKCIEDRVKTIIELKKKVCGDLGKGFVITYQKGIDPFFLNALAKEGIVALCKAKSRNMLVVGQLQIPLMTYILIVWDMQDLSKSPHWEERS